MPLGTLTRFILLPEISLVYVERVSQSLCKLHCHKTPKLEICPKCATPSTTTYDHRKVNLKDAPIYGIGIKLMVKKRRLWCKPCQKPFTEPLLGVRKRYQHTERYGRALRHACDRYSNLSDVRRDFRCSSGFLYQTYYRHLELRRKMREHPWPKILGIDEHSFKRDPIYRHMKFASIFVDYRKKQVMELAEGKSQAELEYQLAQIPGRDLVKTAIIDLSESFRNFVKNFFPHAEIVADKFHVIKLLTPALLRKRREIAGSRADIRAKKLLLMSGSKLRYLERHKINEFLKKYPQMLELYQAKEMLHRFYESRNPWIAEKSFNHMLDLFAHSSIAEIKTLRRTLLRWRFEILNYFKFRLTNARTESYNNVAKLIKRKAYGYRSFKNYRLRLLDACHA